MRRPHVYQRSGRRNPGSRTAPEPVNAAQSIADKLEPLIEQADEAGHAKLGDLLDDAQEEAERIAAG